MNAPTSPDSLAAIASNLLGCSFDHAVVELGMSDADADAFCAQCWAVWEGDVLTDSVEHAIILATVVELGFGGTVGTFAARRAGTQ